MPEQAYRYWVTRRVFEDEELRRAHFGHARARAAEHGYRGRISLRWIDFHGRKQRVVEVSVHR